MKKSSKPHSVAKLLACILILSVTSCSSSWFADRRDSPRIQDLKTLYTKLPSVHKDFFHAHHEEAYTETYNQVLPLVDTMSDIDFYFTLRKLAAYSADSHTAIGTTQELVEQFHAIPVQFIHIGDAWRISIVEQSKSYLLGAELLAINGIPIEHIIEKATPLFGHDNTVWLHRAIAQQLNLTELFTYLGIMDNPLQPVELTLIPYKDGTQDASDTTETIVLQPMTRAAYKQLPMTTLYEHIPPTGLSSEPYRTLLLNDGATLFIQYNACVSDPSYPIKTFIEETLHSIAEYNPDQIIVDLRDNGGGDSRLFEPMIRALGRHQSTKGFQLDILIGEGTFSSAIINAIQLKQQTEARLVGTPSGGSVNHYGEVRTFTLPNSKLPIWYSKNHFTLDKTHPGGSLQPDILIEPTITDMLNGIDTIVAAIL